MHIFEEKFNSQVLLGDEDMKKFSEDTIAKSEFKNSVIFIDSLKFVVFRTHRKRSGVDFALKKISLTLCKVTTCKVLILLVFDSGHWSLLCIFNESKTCYHYDPFPGGFTSHEKLCFDFVNTLYLQGSICVPPNILHLQGLPSQHDSWDCGYWTLYYLETLLKKNVLEPLTCKDFQNKL
jgi:hypothetical protein